MGGGKTRKATLVESKKQHLTNIHDNTQGATQRLVPPARQAVHPCAAIVAGSLRQAGGTGRRRCLGSRRGLGAPWGKWHRHVTASCAPPDHCARGTSCRTVCTRWATRPCVCARAPSPAQHNTGQQGTRKPHCGTTLWDHVQGCKHNRGCTPTSKIQTRHHSHTPRKQGTCTDTATHKRNNSRTHTCHRRAAP